jgi:hypothetical protein
MGRSHPAVIRLVADEVWTFQARFVTEAEERGEAPARVRGPGKGFEKFDENNLALLYQDDKADGEPSTFFTLVNPERLGAF